MIFAKLDVCFHRHPKFVRAGVEACGYWAAVLAYLRDHKSDSGLLPDSEIKLPLHIGERKARQLCQRLVDCGLFERQEGGYLLLRYAEKNETGQEIDARLAGGRRRLSKFRGKTGTCEADHRTGNDDVTRFTAQAVGSVKRVSSANVTRSTSLVESESESESELILSTPVAPTPPDRARTKSDPSGDHQALVAHFAAEFERIKGAKPEIGAKGGAGAKRLLLGRTLDEAKAIVDRALSDAWLVDHTPDLSAIAAKINAYIGKTPPSGVMRRANGVALQPAGGGWKAGDGT